MNAIRYAVELFKYERSDFYIMHVYKDDIYADDALLDRESIEMVTTQVSENSLKKLTSTLSEINTFSPNPRNNYKIVSANNLLIDEADKIVNKKNIDVIVMGTKGITNSKKVTFGSNTLQVLKYVMCPVLAIPENYKFTQPKHLLFPTNYMIPYKRRELKLLCETVSPYRAVIDMLYISKSEKLSRRQENNKAFIKEELHKNTINFKVVKSKNIINSIYKYIKEHHIDMLVMVNTRHSFLEALLFKSTIDELSLYLDTPFLVLQNMRRNQF